jgi:hypothetical protein
MTAVAHQGVIFGSVLTMLRALIAGYYPMTVYGRAERRCEQRACHDRGYVKLKSKGKQGLRGQYERPMRTAGQVSPAGLE